MTLEKTYTAMPEWIRDEEPKYQTAFFTFLVKLNLFGTRGKSLREFFTLAHKDDWTDADTDYTIEKFLEHKIIELK